MSRKCSDVVNSVEFYCGILGFQEIVRPQFDFKGAWLFAYGVGIHLIHGQPLQRPKAIDPRADHLSFQAESLELVEERLLEHGLPYVKQTVVEGGVRVHQVFIHDPDGSMIEICNCEVLPVIPLNVEGTSDCCRTSCFQLDMKTAAYCAPSMEISPQRLNSAVPTRAAIPQLC